MHVADALSRATVDPAEQYLDSGWMMYELRTVTACSAPRLEELRKETAGDHELQCLKAVITSGWPDAIKDLNPLRLIPYLNRSHMIGSSQTRSMRIISVRILRTKSGFGRDESLGNFAKFGVSHAHGRHIKFFSVS